MDLLLDLEPGDDVVYVGEAVEQIDQIEQGLLVLERDAADEGTLGTIFRAAHTLKGSAATIGHARMAELTHALEEAFGALRDGRLRDLNSFGDMLLSTVDVLRVMVDEVAAGHTLTDAAEPLARSITDRLALALSGDLPPDASTPPEGLPLARPLDAARLKRLIDESLGTDEARSVISFEVAERSSWAGVRLLQGLLTATETGRLLGSVPSLEEIEAGIGGSSLLALMRGHPQEHEDLRERLAAMEEVERAEVVALGDVVAIGATERVAPAGEEAAAIRRSTAHTVRIEVGQLDELMDLVGELIVQRTRLRRQARQLADQLGEDPLATDAEDGARQFAKVVDRLQAGVTRLRMLPIDTVFARFPRLVHDVSAQLGKSVDLVLEGSETELDRSLLEEVGDPLAHLVRNALDHGLEPIADRIAAGKPERGEIRVAALHADGRVIVEVRDDGRGMDPAVITRVALERGLVDAATVATMSPAEALRLVFLPGFSTARQVTSVSGRGVGMDVVLTNIERLGGQVSISSTPGVGTTVRMSLPLTLAIIEALLVRTGRRICAIPLGAVVETQRVPYDEVRTVSAHRVLSLASSVVPLRGLAAALGDREVPAVDSKLKSVLVRSHGAEFALGVDEFLGTEEIVLKTIGLPGELPGISGATILADGRVALVLDVDALVGSDQPAERSA